MSYIPYICTAGITSITPNLSPSARQPPRKIISPLKSAVVMV
jgi:hypothetical protein